MAKLSELQRAIAAVEAEIAVQQRALTVLRAAQRPATTKRAVRVRDGQGVLRSPVSAADAAVRS